jgi:MFS family permease
LERRPDGGYGWIVVACAFTSMACVFGVAYSYGAFFDAIARDFGAGKGATSVPFALTSALFFTLGLVTGPLADRYGPRRVVLAGAGALAGGLLVAAAARSLWLEYLGYGIGVGIGVACGYVPTVAVVSAWFPARRGTALGIAVSGIGVGTIAGPLAAAGAIGAIGWRWSYVTFAATAFALLVICALLLELPADHPPVPLRLSASVRTRTFAWLYAAGLFMAFPLTISFVYLAPFAEDHGAGRVAAAALVSLIGAGSVAGRLVLGWVADRGDRLLTMRACFALMVAACACWLAGGNYPTLVVFAVTFGIGYGGWVALMPAVVADVFGAAALGGTIGALYTSAALAALAAPPLAGVVIDATDTYRWVLAAMLAIALLAFASLLPVGRRAAQRPVRRV